MKGIKEKSFVIGIPFFVLICSFVSYSQNFIGYRNGHAMVYDEHNANVIVFGGANEKEVLNETWILEKFYFRKVESQGPSARTFPNMVYDAYNKQVLMFGGNPVLFGDDYRVPILFNDLWAFKNEEWHKIETSESPHPRSEASMAYDKKRNKVVLFGGIYFNEKRKIVRLGDIWEFDGKEWIEIHPIGSTPLPRSGAVMVYDDLREKVLLIGGHLTLKSQENFQGPVWEWDGKSWNTVDVKNLNLIYNPSVAYNSIENYCLLFGGWNGKERLDETLKSNSYICQKLDFVGEHPAKRNHSQLVFDQKNEQFILYGGHNGDYVLGDLWIFKEDKWQCIIKRAPRLRVNNGH